MNTLSVRSILALFLAGSAVFIIFVAPLETRAQEKIYWVDAYDEWWEALDLKRANLDASDIEHVITTPIVSPHKCTVDLANRTLYWVDETLNRIQRANLDGSNVESVISSGLKYPRDVEIDTVGGKIYWTDWSTGVNRANLEDGTNVENLIGTDYVAEALTLDLVNKKLYFCASYGSFWGGPGVLRANLDGTNVECLVNFGSSYDGYGFVDLALDVGGNSMYWSGQNKYSSYSSALYRANLTVSCVGRSGVDSLGVAVSSVDSKPAMPGRFKTGQGEGYVFSLP